MGKREKLPPTVDTIRLCGHLGLLLTGHIYDKTYYAELGSNSSGQVGTFIEPLNLKVRSGDTNLKNRAKNANYISQKIQNVLISRCGKVILVNIICEVKHSKYFP